MNRWQIGYCVTCTNPSCPFPDRKLQVTGNCREWTGGVAVAVSVKIDLEDAANRLSRDQFEALVDGAAEILKTGSNKQAELKL